jgi:hypothetical protein
VLLLVAVVVVVGARAARWDTGVASTLPVVAATPSEALSTRGAPAFARRDPLGSWRALAPAPLAPRRNAAAAWSGRELLVWGGVAETGRGATLAQDFFADGAAYNPTSDRWRPLPPAPLRARGGAVAAWTGQELLVWGGRGEGGRPGGAGGHEPPGLLDGDAGLGDGAAYDPGTDTWRPIGRAPERLLTVAAATWSGEELLVWGGGPRGGLPRAGAAYDPAADRWRRLPPLPVRPASSAAVAWTRGRLLAVGERDGEVVAAAFDPATSRWATVAAPPLAAAPRALVAVGHAVFASSDDAAARYDPHEDRWFPTAAVPLPVRDRAAADGWVLAWDGRTPASGAVYTPAIDTWVPMTPAPLSARRGHVTAWTGWELLVWGGTDTSGQFADGAGYHPGY